MSEKSQGGYEMNKKNNSILPKPIKRKKHLSSSDGKIRSSRYNNTVMKEEIALAEEGFADRLANLRTTKHISAREMSLSLGQGASYVNDIENGRYLPSMGMFFEICEYLEVSPLEFFDYTATLESGSVADISAIAKRLKAEDRECILALEKRLLR